MDTLQGQSSSGAAAGVMAAPDSERERIFEAFRRWGYLEADLDPLGFLTPERRPELQFENETAEEARQIYCGTIGAEFMHIADPERRRWIQKRLEGPQRAVDQNAVLDQLIRADLFEQVLQHRYLGSKRFSLEGVTALIPLVNEMLESAGERGAAELVMGMSHRGRLNVIVQVARRPPEEVFAGFEDVDPRSVLGSGDVKYHMGATGEYVTRNGAKIHVHLASNPSHLEAVDPVTIGRTRAKQDRTGKDGAKKYLPLLVHGDGAFAGQGITAETLNYARSARLQRGRHGACDRQQPDWIYHHAQRTALLALCGADCPPAGYSHLSRQRGRCGRGGARGANGSGISLYLRQRRGRGPDRLPPPWPQRSG